MCLIKYDRLLFLLEITTLSLFIQVRARIDTRSVMRDPVCYMSRYETLLWIKVVAGMGT